MKNKKSTRTAIIVSAVLIVGAVLAACTLGAGSKDGGLTLHESPQQYILQEEKSLEIASVNPQK
ncbi:MAG: hypothetical protein LBR98_00550 [Syntrophomonadaceae bacterium]|jgi:predicted small secreted protein|nr:hypothetical protein [Syntrophomonadaceae bacterium]